MRIPDKLPDLRGRTLLSYRIVWVIAFLLALVSIADTVREDFRNRALVENMTALGMVIYDRRSIRNIGPTDLANDYDIVEGDFLLAIDGRPVTSEIDPIAFTEGPDGADVLLLIQTPGEAEPRTVHVTRNSSYIADVFAGSGLSYTDERNVRLFTRLLQTGAWLLVALLLYLRRPGDLVAALISLGAVVLTINLRLMLPAVPSGIFDLTGPTGLALLMIGLLFFPGGRIEPRWSVFGIPVIVAVSGWVAMANITNQPAIYWTPLAVASMFLIVLSAILVRYRHYANEESRQQIKFVLLGLALTVAIMLPVIGWFRLEVNGFIDVGPWLGLLRRLMQGIAFLALPIGLLIALLRYRLFDADRVISRSTTYAMMTLLIGIAFFAMERAIDFIGNQLVGGGIGAASFGIAAALAAVLLNPLHARLIKWSERRFQKALISLRDDLPEAARDMRQIASMDELLNELLERIAPAVHARSASILSADRRLLASRGEQRTDLVAWAEHWQPVCNKNGLDIDRKDENYPLRLALRPGEVEPIAWLILGPRIDDSFYNRDERDVVASLADPMARAIATVAQRERREASVNGEIAALREQMTALETAIRSALDRLGPTEPKPT